MRKLKIGWNQRRQPKTAGLALAGMAALCAATTAMALPWPDTPADLHSGETAGGITNAAAWYRLNPAGDFHHGLRMTFDDVVTVALYDHNAVLLTNGAFTHWGWTPQDGEPCYLGITPQTEVQYTARLYNLTNTIAQVSALLTNKMAEFNLIGCGIALVDGAYPVWQTGFGHADLARGIPADEHTVFMIGSCSKTFGGLAVMQLVEQARLDLDAPLADALPGFAIHQRFAGGIITPRTILTHHSGLPGDIFNGMFTTGRENPDFTAWLENYLADDYTLAPTNHCWAYNNSGFVMLGNAIAQVTGESLTNYARANLFLRMGMTNTSLLRDLPHIANHMAKPYINGAEYPEEQCMGYFAGSILSTAADMSRYMRALLNGGMGENGRVVEAATLEAMTTKQNDGITLDSFSTSLNMGLAFVLNPPQLHYMGKTFWHDGGTVYFRTLFRVASDAGLGAFVSFNSAEAESVKAGIIDSALRWAYEDKTGIAPPAPVVPIEAPIVAASADIIDMAAHIFITSSGFDQFATNAAGGLRWTRNAHDDTPAVTDLVHRADGWFTPVGTLTTQLLFTQAVGRVVCIMKNFADGVTNTALYGDRADNISRHEAWDRRAGRWWAIDVHPYDITWPVPTGVGHLMLELSIKAGMPAITPTAMPAANVQIFSATDADIGFTAGLGRNKGASVRITGAGADEILRWMGVRFRHADNIPILACGHPATGTVAGNTATWYSVLIAANAAATIDLAADGDVVARVHDTTSEPLATAVNGQPCQIPADTTARLLMIAVLRNGNNPGNYQLTVTTGAPQRPAAGDFDGDGLADPAILDAAGNFYFWGSRTAYQRQGSFPLLTGYPAAGDFDGDGLADPAILDAAGNFYFWGSRTAYQRQGPFPLLTGQPAAGDFDGDGLADPVILDAAGNFYFWGSHTAYQRQGSFPLGMTGQPAAGDFDGDGLADPVIVNDTGAGYVWLSRNGYQRHGPVALGMIGHPTAGDFDGDGLSDLAMPSGAGNWYAWLSSMHYTRTGPYLL